MTGPIIAVEIGKGRDPCGRFASGPGNVGRPRGTKNAVSRNALQAVQALSDLAIAKLRERIDLGDMAAIKLCLEYTLPRGGRTVELETTGADDVGEALAAGDLSPEEADKIASAFGKLQNIHQVEELRQRLDELEAAMSERRQ